MHVRSRGEYPCTTSSRPAFTGAWCLLKLHCLDQVSFPTSCPGSGYFMPTVSREWVYTEDGPEPATIKYVAQRKENRMIDGRLVKGRWWMEWLHIKTDRAAFKEDERITWHKMHPTWFPRGAEPWTKARIARKAEKKRLKRAAAEEPRPSS